MTRALIMRGVSASGRKRAGKTTARVPPAPSSEKPEGAEGAEGAGLVREAAAFAHGAPSSARELTGLAGAAHEAAFVHVRSVHLEQRAGARLLDPTEVVGTSSGHFWLVDRGARDVKIYAPTGRIAHVLRGGSRLADLCAPVSIAPVHGSWIAVLDAGAGRVALYDERARRHGGFDLPQVEDPLQIRSLGDRHLAVVGRGGAREADRLVHLYRLDGRHTESVFTISHRAVRETPGGPPASRSHAGQRHVAAARPAPQSAAAGHSILVAYAPARSVVVYDFGTRMVRSIPLEPEPGHGRVLSGLFPVPEGSVVVMYDTQDSSARYAYDVYDRDGELVAGHVRSPQRLVGVEGRLFYSIAPAEAGAAAGAAGGAKGGAESGAAGGGEIALRVCRLRGPLAASR
ncbi:MAG: hypothetical protein HY702_06750 [Gemmatimonadetes bacterium]|nr:hypothetical protein [Gemmatimonadota bacterium]